MINKYLKRFHKRFTDFLMDGGVYGIFVVGITAIILAIIAHYGKYGFNWKWFTFFELPLYIFCIWALYNAVKLLNNVINISNKSSRKP